VERTSFDARVNSVLEVLGPQAEASRYGRAGRAESAEARQNHPSDVLARVESVLQRMPADEVEDSAAFQKAYAMLLTHGELALKQLGRGATSQRLSADHLGSLEAIVIADGSRPSFLLRNGGRFDPEHPFMGLWKDHMLDFAPDLRRLAAAVGRIQPVNGNAANYFGTGTLIDRNKGLVLTNFHVLDAARESPGIAIDGEDRELKVTGDLVIDFDAESGTNGRNRFRVVHASLPEGFGIGFAGIDAAVLRIEPMDPQSKLPAYAPALSVDPDLSSGSSTTLVTVGFPGEPIRDNPPGATVDWHFVITTLFGNRFGVKRVAPGRFGLAPGSVEGDAFERVMSHDATTFGGASGSLMYAWKDQGTPGYGLHFSGATLSANYALSLQRAADALKAIGVPLV
jgi:serine protease